MAVGFGLGAPPLAFTKKELWANFPHGKLVPAGCVIPENKWSKLVCAKCEVTGVEYFSRRKEEFP
jgi:hypothetical protein